jgi:DNA-binding transcriptional MerR regulator
VSDRSYLAIGEVLALLREEFPDVTISKIRFLESQGLLDPERTPSGYRKFYEDDIERLRWILTQQREHFLPLKVIKDRLDEANRAGAVVPADLPLPVEPEVATPATAAAPPPATPPASSTAPTAPAPGPTAPAPPRTAAAASSSTNPLDAGPSGVSLSAEELAGAAGLDTAQLEELFRYGLLQGRTVGSDVFYDGDALVIARTAAGFLEHGIEARHIRSYKVAVEREAGLFEQIVLPLLKQRNPEAKRRATQTVAELMRLGDDMRSVLLRRGLRDHIPPP